MCPWGCVAEAAPVPHVDEAVSVSLGPCSRHVWLFQVRLSQVREEKMAEERSKKKLWKKNGEADAWKQKALRVVRAARGPSCT